MDITTELERALSAPPGEPDHRALEDLLLEGHRSLRRRRASIAGVTVALVAAVAVGAGALISPSDTAGRSIATDPTQSSTVQSTEAVPGLRTDLDQYAGFVDGELAVAGGVEVLEQVDNPFGYAAPSDSAALRLNVSGEELWTLATWTDNGQGVASGSTESADPDEVQQRTFAGWVHVQQLIHGDASALVQLVSGPAGLPLVPRVGATILDQRADVDLGETFTPEGWTAAVAMAEDAQGGRWFVLVRVSEDTAAEYIPVRVRDAGDATTIEEFLDFARPRYESGEGLR